jgi:hypothetical protein
MNKRFDIAFPKLRLLILDGSFCVGLKFGVMECKFGFDVFSTISLGFHLKKNKKRN